AVPGTGRFHAAAFPDPGGAPMLALAVGRAGALATAPGGPAGLGREREHPAMDLGAAAGHDDLLHETLTVVDHRPPGPGLVEQLLQPQLRGVRLRDEDG